MINLNKKLKNSIVNIKILPVCCILIAGFSLLSSCETKRVIYTPTGYNITKPESFDLGTKLNEISGIVYISDSLMLANNDESGKIFAIKLNNMKDFEYRNIKFGKKDDYEDIAKVDSAIYVLISTGTILKVTDYSSDETVKMEEVARLEGKENEFESLYFDPEINSLIMLCKNCHKEKDKVRSAYRFD